MRGGTVTCMSKHKPLYPDPDPLAAAPKSQCLGSKSLVLGF